MNDQSEAPKLWAAKGEAVTCVKGHAICSLACNVYHGEPRDQQHFTDWQQPEPDRSTSVAKLRCAQCRGAWIRGNPREGYQFHFGDEKHGEWR